MKNILRMKIFIRTLTLLSCFLWVTLYTHATHRYKIAIIHSYEKNYHDADRYRHILEKELKANGVAFEMKELFMNSDELLYHDEMARASSFIDELDKWGVEAIGIFNNQATYSLLKCGNPKLRHIPVVFSGVYHPDIDLIREYPNVTGYVDIPDYTSTIRMIEHIMGTSRIVVMSGSGMIDSQMWANIEEQCHNAKIETFEEDIFQHILAHRVIKDAYKEKKESFYNEKIDTTIVMRLMSETMPLRTIQQVARGSETFLMLTSRTYNSQDAPDFFSNPSFAVINESFGTNNKMLGGYFTPLETQLKDMAKGVSLRLQGEMPEQQITQSQKQYVLNWNVMRRYNISDQNLLPEYQVMYVPFSVRYRYYIRTGIILGGVFIVLVIVFLTYGLIRERKRKKEALRNLLYEHKTLKLAIEGGTTFAWRKVKGNLSFDSHFYKLIAYPHTFITLEQILTFIHPDDQERFRAGFLQDHKDSNYKEEYRCKFSGEYKWWEFRYSYINNGDNAFVVTGLLQNIQEIKDREAELIQARLFAERAELKQSFLNNMSHEIRTPLNAIVGFSNILINDSNLAEEEKREFVDIINLNNDLLLNLINDILEMSRIDSGTVSFVQSEVDVRTVVCTCYQTFSVQIKPSLKFLQDFPEEDVTICVDKMRLQQVITNFLTNANKFTPTGYIKLGYRYFPDKNVIHIFVEDSGIGIPADELKMIFSRFYKHDEFVQGTGLGLSISRSIIERMNGQIEVKSEEGKGSRFTIVLPAVS
ncbi:ATP-binding protein [Bacteroides sp.]